jgi:ribosome recycling factor
MTKSVEALKHELQRLRTGRASTALVEHLKVNYYGSDVPMTQVANIAIADARSLTITPWEKTMVQPIEKAILASDLGLTPNTAGTVIINLPPLTEAARNCQASPMKKPPVAVRISAATRCIKSRKLRQENHRG